MVLSWTAQIWDISTLTEGPIDQTWSGSWQWLKVCCFTKERHRWRLYTWHRLGTKTHVLCGEEGVVLGAWAAWKCWNMYIIICEIDHQSRCMRQGAQGWCTGMTQRDGTGREVGGGFRMGDTCTPMADSCQCTQKSPQCCKVISLQSKQNKTKKENGANSFSHPLLSLKTWGKNNLGYFIWVVLHGFYIYPRTDIFWTMGCDPLGCKINLMGSIGIENKGNGMKISSCFMCGGSEYYFVKFCRRCVPIWVYWLTVKMCILFWIMFTACLKASSEAIKLWNELFGSKAMAKGK